MIGAERSLSVIRAHRLELSKAFAEGGPCLLPDKASQILEDYIDYLEQELVAPNDDLNLGQVQEMLLEVSCIVRSGNKDIHPDQYGRFLERLTGIYAQGFSTEEKERFSATAPDYAEVIEAISRELPGYDYREAVGQLLYYLNHLYRSRKSSWITVYQHILSMPDSIAAIQTLKEAYFRGIQQWVEEGVQNLFHIGRDLQQRVNELNQKTAGLTRLIEQQRDLLDRERRCPEFTFAGNITSLDQERRKREIAELLDRREQTLRERSSKEQIAELIECNIREFETALKEARRAYFVQLVYRDQPG